MMKRFFLLSLFSSLCVLTIYPQDTTKVVSLSEVEVVSSPKESGPIHLQPVSASRIGGEQMASRKVTSLKGVTDIVPNFFMPDYGSRLTSAIYIRGVGSRINTPAVGMYVDNIPYVEKSAYDFNFYDVESIDVLRGPQGTLYGRNSMGGVVKVYTKNPFRYQGTDIKLGYATKDNHRTISLTHYHRISNEFAFSAGGYYEGGDGFFRNDSTGRKVDAMSAGGGRIRALWLPTRKIKMDLSVSYDYSDEGAYPYYYEGSITNNHENRYRRGLFNAGLNLEYKASWFTMNAVTGYQNLNDRMFIDQDFISRSIYTLEQKQTSNMLSEEVIFRNNKTEDSRWNWLTGVSGFWQTMHTDAPVTFENEGIETMIEDNVNSIFSRIKAENPRMPNMGIDILQNEFVVSSKMSTPTLSGALFHQSNLNVGNWCLTIGARLEYENLKLDYLSDCNIDYNFSLTDYHRDFPLNATPLFNGKMNRDYWQLLPKFSAQYFFSGKNQLYATVAKGYRSGGYNVQMFSDLIKNEMRNQMIDQIDEVSHGMVPDKENLKVAVDINDVVYRPEYSWNYELGAKWQSGMFGGQCAVFYIDTRDQQISRFADSGLGRMMLNAGKSRSIGAEVEMRYAEYLRMSYGYTDAKFREYNDGVNDYKDNYVPFIPMHNFDIALEWPLKLRKAWISSLTLGANYAGAGRIYWTEDNASYQNFYGLLGAHVAADFGQVGVNIWAKNITNTRYDTFYFESMSRGFAQHGKPMQMGLDVTIKL